MGFVHLGFAQRGPGGVSVETPNSLNPTQSTNRLWLDASKITGIADGDLVDEWNDISHSNRNDKAFWEASDNFIPPIFRDDAAYTINGFPVLTFGEGRQLKINSSPDLNTSITTTRYQTIFLAFRTGSDVEARQVVWEEGGGWRGMNVVIFGGEVYLGIYDKQPDPDGVPPFGYTYRKAPVQPNTTYVVSHVTNAPATATLSLSTNALFGSVNGNPSAFGPLLSGGQYAAGVGGVYQHPDPIGVGAQNSDSFYETGPLAAQTGAHPFLGRLAEVCYYNEVLSPTEQIIVENYLGAKYYANIIVNDRYSHQASYGQDVIGIGRSTTQAADPAHTTSQGQNLFEISPNNPSDLSGPNQFFLVGHNGGSLNWNNTNVPRPSSMSRLQRIWRVDETGADIGEILFRTHTNYLPALPSGRTKYALIVDNVNENFPDFSNPDLPVHELMPVGGGYYETTYNFEDNDFFTVVALTPEIEFVTPEAYAIESDPAPDSTLLVNSGIQLKLNFIPGFAPDNWYTINYRFDEGTALRSVDFGYNTATQTAGATIYPGMQSVNIPVYIVNDGIAEDPATESFFVVLESGPQTTPGLTIGPRDSVEFSIYDNDPDPEFTFAQNTSTVNEADGICEVTVLRTGSTVGTSVVRIQRKMFAMGTATPLEDYDLPGWTLGAPYNCTSCRLVTFAPGENSKTVSFPIINDLIDEPDQTIEFRAFPGSNFSSSGSSILEHTVIIEDDDPEPVIQFLAASSEGYTSLSQPQMYVYFSPPSEKTVYVDYELAGSSTANASHFDMESPGTIIFPPGDTLIAPIANVYFGAPVPPEGVTLNLNLTGSVNATLGTPLTHSYLIKDYQPFENAGLAGIGQLTDNIFWINGQSSGSNGDVLSSIPNLSPRNITISQSTANRRAQVRGGSEAINGYNTIKFDGSNDFYSVGRPTTLGQDGVINTGTEYSRKAFTVVIRTPSTLPAAGDKQVIFEQGGGARGLNLYLANQGGNQGIYLSAYQKDEMNGQLAWGGGSAGGNATVTKFCAHPVAPNTEYLVTCIFDASQANNQMRLRMYVNGQESAIKPNNFGNPIAKLFVHTGRNAIGGVDLDTRFHDNEVVASGSHYSGYLAEFVYYNEADFNETRRIILENALALKYDINLHAEALEVIDPNFGDQSDASSYFGHQTAGIGRTNANDMHGDSRGNSILRVKSTAPVNNNSYLIWGHNNVPLSSTWPFSSDYLPSGIMERSGRVWKFFESGEMGPVSIYMNYSASDNASLFELNDLKLLIHQNEDPQEFANAQVINATALESGYVVRFDNVNPGNGSYIALANTNGGIPLPVTLLDFKARYDEPTGDVNLFWSTATEINSDYFVVERSGSNMVFAPILERPAAGHSNQTQNYIASDPDPDPGVYYYRLRQFDYDGSFMLYDPVMVVAPGNSEEDVMVFPNPVENGLLNVKVPAVFADDWKRVSVHDLRGFKVYDRTFYNETSLLQIQLNSKLSTGIYVLSIESPEYFVTKKIMLQ